jgi:hypothetical protein
MVLPSLRFFERVVVSLSPLIQGQTTMNESSPDLLNCSLRKILTEKILRYQISPFDVFYKICGGDYRMPLAVDSWDSGAPVDRVMEWAIRPDGGC